MRIVRPLTLPYAFPPCRPFTVAVGLGSSLRSGDRDEPSHVHVERDDCEAKFWLDPVRLERSGGFARKELRLIQTMVEDDRQHLLDRWHEHFHG